MRTILDGYAATHKPLLRVIDLASATAAELQATAYAMAQRLAPDGRPVVIFADPIEPSLSVGAHQNIERDVDLSYCRDHGIPIVRRRLGGGGLYIDRNQLIFHIITRAGHAPWPVCRMPSSLATAVVDTHRDLEIAARLRPPADVVVGGRKIAGLAGAEIGGNVVVGGAFLFDFDAVATARCLKFPSETSRAKVARMLERSMTTMRAELGAPPDRAMVKARLVANLASRLDTAAGISQERLEEAARRD
jgi:lipoate-protein ligase A